MNSYTPDLWVIVEIDVKGHSPVRKVLASWYGGYTSGDAWKLSSGNLEVIDEGDHYRIPQSSGSEYICYKNAVGMSGYTSSVLASWQEQLRVKDSNSTIKVVKI